MSFPLSCGDVMVTDQWPLFKEPAAIHHGEMKVNSTNSTEKKTMKVRAKAELYIKVKMYILYTYFSLKDQSIYSVSNWLIYLVGVSHKYWQCHSWVAVSQTLKFLPLALVRNDIVYSPPARRQCHSLLEQEEEISMSARLPPRNGPFPKYW